MKDIPFIGIGKNSYNYDMDLQYSSKIAQKKGRNYEKEQINKFPEKIV